MERQGKEREIENRKDLKDGEKGEKKGTQRKEETCKMDRTWKRNGQRDEYKDRDGKRQRRR